MEKTVLFNPHFSEFFTNESRYCILFGGAGSGKSHAVAQKIVERCTRPNEKHKFLVVRKFRTTLEGSVFTLIRSIISDFGIYQHVSINNTKMSFTFSNGNEIIVTGLDDPEKIKSIHGITGIWCEEITELEEDDFQQLDLRLRGVTDSYMQICMSFNPISIDHWIYKMFFENEVPDTFKLWSNYKHNLFLDDAYINVLESRFDYDQNMKRIYVLGEWGKIKTNEEFYCMFDKERNVNTVVYNPELPIHMSFDFNVNPYFPVSLWQIQDIDGVFRVGCFKLYALENPYNNTEAACEAFIEDFPNYDMGVYIYGDASGRAKSTTSRVHNYDVINSVLKPYIRNWSMRVPRKNPSISKRRDFINKCFAGGYEDIMVVVDPSCDLMIADMENVFTDMAQGKHKPKSKNKAGVLFEKYGHFSDTLDYLLCMAFEKRFRDFGIKF